VPATRPKFPPGVTPCDKCPLRKLDGFRRFTSEELAFMMDFKSGELAVEAGTTILSEGSDGPHLYTLLSGWVFKYKTLEDGRRQVTNFGLPGDLIGLQASMFDAMTHSVEALTDAALCILPRAKIWPLYKNFEGLAFDVTWLAAREEAMLTEYLATVGQRNSMERVAFVLLDLFRRAQRSGLVKNGQMMLPIAQHHLADTIGFSLVHTNKVLQKLRRTDCFNWTNSSFVMRDEAKLAGIAMASEPAERVRPFL
jgi:CRP/FNR family transcriptional regulator, anaerobic regulatory protein